jgi:alpha-L-fucosidase
MLGVPGALKTARSGDTLTITMPDLGPEAAPCRHAFAFRLEGADVLPE